MKNKMMKTAGLLLASTCMLIANGVFALETCRTDFITEDGRKVTRSGSCDQPIKNEMGSFTSVTSLSNPNMLEDYFNDKNTNAYYDFFTHKSSEVTTSKGEAKIIENFIKEWVLAQEFHKYTYVISEEHSVIQKKHTSSPISVSKYRDNKGEVTTTFTSKDGTLEIKVTERGNTEKEDFNTSNNDVADNNKETTHNYDYSTDPTCNEPVKISQYLSEVVCDGSVILTKQQDVSMFDRIKLFIQQN